MDILIVGGTHGDERTGIDVIARLRRERVANIDVLVANPHATKTNRRFIETDLNRSFGVKQPQSYEEKRAVRITPFLKRYDLVLEFHNTVSMTTCAIFTSETPTEQQLAIVEHFELRYAVIMPPSRSLSGQNCLKTVSFEISIRDEKFSVEFLVEKIKILDNSIAIAITDAAGVEIYCCRGKNVTIAQLTEAGLSIYDFLDFQTIDKKKAKLLCLEPQYVPFLVGEKAYGENFAFNVAERIEKRRKENNGKR